MAAQPTGGQREEHQRVHLVEPGRGGDGKYTGYGGDEYQLGKYCDITIQVIHSFHYLGN